MATESTTKIGDIVMLHDLDTRFSNKAVVRPYLVAAIAGSSMTVLPRTASGSSGVWSPAGEPPGLSKDGRFVRVPIAVSAWLVREAQNLGQLPEPHRASALALFGRTSK